MWAPCVSLIMVVPRSSFFSSSVWKRRDKIEENISWLCIRLCIYPSQWNNLWEASGCFPPSHPLLWDHSWRHMLLLFRFCYMGNAIMFSGSFSLPYIKTQKALKAINTLTDFQKKYPSQFMAYHRIQENILQKDCLWTQAYRFLPSTA